MYKKVRIALHRLETHHRATELWILFTLKVIRQRSKSRVFGVLCAHNTAATRGLYLALSKAWWPCTILHFKPALLPADCWLNESILLTQQTASCVSHRVTYKDDDLGWLQLRQRVLWLLKKLQDMKLTDECAGHEITGHVVKMKFLVPINSI